MKSIEKERVWESAGRERLRLSRESYPLSSLGRGVVSVCSRWESGVALGEHFIFAVCLLVCWLFLCLLFFISVIMFWILLSGHGGKGGHGDQVIDKIRLRMKFSIIIIANEIESSIQGHSHWDHMLSSEWSIATEKGVDTECIPALCHDSACRVEERA